MHFEFRPCGIDSGLEEGFIWLEKILQKRISYIKADQ
jgi:hypothetical protein